MTTTPTTITCAPGQGYTCNPTPVEGPPQPRSSTPTTVTTTSTAPTPGSALAFTGGDALGIVAWGLTIIAIGCIVVGVTKIRRHEVVNPWIAVALLAAALGLIAASAA